MQNDQTVSSIALQSVQSLRSSIRPSLSVYSELRRLPKQTLLFPIRNLVVLITTRLRSSFIHMFVESDRSVSPLSGRCRRVSFRTHDCYSYIWRCLFNFHHLSNPHFNLMISLFLM